MMEAFLNIASFSISVGGLVAIFVVRGSKKRIVLSMVVATLCATSGVTLYSYYRHEMYVNRVQNEMMEILSQGTVTFDDLYQNIFPPVAHELLREALYEGVEEGMIGYRPMRLQNKGKIMSVKVFFAR